MAFIFKMLCAIWYHLYNSKKVRNTHGGVLFLEKLQALAAIKVTLLHGCFSFFLNCKNSIKSRNASHSTLSRPAISFYIPWKHSISHKVFWCFQKVKKGTLARNRLIQYTQTSCLQNICENLKYVSFPRYNLYLCNLNPFVPNAPFPYPLKKSENLTVFWCFQGVEQEFIGNEWVKTFINVTVKDYFIILNERSFITVFQFLPVFLITSSFLKLPKYIIKISPPKL